MKKNIFLLLSALLFQTFLSAQNCKFDYDKVDAFTGKRTVSMKPDLARGWGMAIISNGGNYEIDISVIVGGVTKNVINKGDTLMMAVEGSVPIILLAGKESAPTSNVAGTTIYSAYAASYPISRKELQRLSQGKMIALRMFVGSTPFNLEVKEKNAVKISKAAGCIAAEQ